MGGCVPPSRFSVSPSRFSVPPLRFRVKSVISAENRKFWQVGKFKVWCWQVFLEVIRFLKMVLIFPIIYSSAKNLTIFEDLCMFFSCSYNISVNNRIELLITFGLLLPFRLCCSLTSLLVALDGVCYYAICRRIC